MIRQIFNKQNIFFRNLNIELIFWMAGLIYLAFSPLNSESHFTICPLKNLGFDYCPGCGLGSSIINIFHLKILQSFSIHPLGLPALIIIIFRIAELSGVNSIFYLTKTYITKIWSYHGKHSTIPSKS
ncbi:MAG: DUF2752 domain-containing protein [Ignavibacteriales bacterium]|nr:DUF2752 domain-containing protein [Ignavibacteriales bacterium]